MLLGSSTLAVDATSITISGLSSAYTDLLIVCYLRNSAATDNRYCNLRVGNTSVDTGSNYDARSICFAATGTTVTGFNDTGASSFFLRGSLPGSASSYFALVQFVIPKYSNTSNYRSIIADGTAYAARGTGLWKNAASAIDIVQISNLQAGEGLKAGSSIEVYGIQ